MLVEKMQGAWILEEPELSSMTRSQVESSKAFISATSDKVRLSYERRADVFPRQCVFMGSTNSMAYLGDITGGRRFWPISCATPREIDTESFGAEVDQIWAEAGVKYHAMRALQPVGMLPLYLSDPEAHREALSRQEHRRKHSEADDLAGIIIRFLDGPISPGDASHRGFADWSSGDEVKCREITCPIEIWVKALGRDLGDYGGRRTDQLMISNALQLAGWQPIPGTKWTKEFGPQRMWERKPVADEGPC